MSKNLSVSIVIPVYNEAADLPACLDAIAGQSVRPHEVIVVDNNSTDETRYIAAQYPFVTVLRESRQGVVYARDQGFDAASGTIIGRIDADTIIRSDWVETLQRIFADSHGTGVRVDAVSGSARYYDMALAPLVNGIDLLLRRYLARMLGRSVAMQGANMAIRHSTWRSIRRGLCRGPGLHEDFDISIHAVEHGHHVVFDKSLVAALGYRQADANFRDFVEYVMISPRTYANHGLTAHVYLYPVVWLAIVLFLPLRSLHRAYDAETDRVVWSRLFQSDSRGVRVNPATYVD